MEHVIVFFLAGFAQFMYMNGIVVPAQVLFLVLLIGGVYFTGWFALLVVPFGALLGSMLAKSK